MNLAGILLRTRQPFVNRPTQQKGGGGGGRRRFRTLEGGASLGACGLKARLVTPVAPVRLLVLGTPVETMGALRAPLLARESCSLPEGPLWQNRVNGMMGKEASRYSFYFMIVTSPHWTKKKGGTI